jgi:phage baseplate assembly protein W
MSKRADNITQLSNERELFSDFFTDLSKHPITKELARVRNDQSIKQSIKNLIFTNFGERLFQPGIGSNINRVLFEPNDNILSEDLAYHIRKTIEFYEPRVNLLQIIPNINQNTDSISVDIVFAIINSNQIQSLNLILRRVR